MSNKPVLSYGRQTVEQSDIDAVMDVLLGNRLTQGPAVKQFEDRLAQMVNAKYAVAVSSGTAALHIACMAAQVTPADHGITSALTFVASANAMRYCGASVSLTDIDRESLGMDVSSLTKQLADHPNSKVVIPVSFAGLPHEMEKIRSAARSQIIIEDASHSLGGTYEDGTKVGSCSHSDMTVFSFHPVKPITTGEGGAITTNDPEFYHRLKLARDHGIERRQGCFVEGESALENGEEKPWYYEQQNLGFNYRLSDIHAALGLSQLSKLEAFVNRRREIAEIYDQAFYELPNLVRPQKSGEQRNRSAHHIYVVEIDFERTGMTRTEYFSYLRRNGIQSQVHYIPVYRQPYYQDLYHFDIKAFPQTEAYYHKCLTLPLYPSLANSEIDHVIDVVKRSVV